jgi:hypothetical protein
LFERKVLACEVVFLRKFHQLTTVFFQRVAQHVPEALDSAFCHGWPELHQSRQRVQSVEQEMGIQAGANRVQAGSCDQRLCTHGQRLFFVQAIPRLHGIGDSREQPI